MYKFLTLFELVNNGILVTSDYKDLAKFEKEENVKINWFR